MEESFSILWYARVSRPNPLIGVSSTSWIRCPTWRPSPPARFGLVIWNPPVSARASALGGLQVQTHPEVLRSVDSALGQRMVDDGLPRFQISSDVSTIPRPTFVDRPQRSWWPRDGAPSMTSERVVAVKWLVGPSCDNTSTSLWSTTPVPRTSTKCRFQFRTLSLPGPTTWWRYY